MNDHLKFRKEVLDPLSPSFCGAKWYNATIWLGSGKTTSCHHPTPHSVSVEAVEENFKALHNTPEKKLDRLLMQNGDRPDGCNYCWTIEDLPGKEYTSDRPAISSMYTPEDLRAAKNLPVNEDVDLKHIEISFDRTCQFACSYCGPVFSTTWVKDVKKNGGYTGLDTDGGGHYSSAHDPSQLYKPSESNPYVDAFLKWWDNGLHSSLEELRITGGEPLMSGEFWKLFDQIYDSTDTSFPTIAINTNLGYERKILNKLMSISDKVDLAIYTSVESVGKQAEYVRDGLDWEQWKSNTEYLLQSGELKNIRIMSTINALSLATLTELLDLILVWRKLYDQNTSNKPEILFFALNVLRTPEFHSIHTLPQQIKEKYAIQLTAWLNKNKDELFFTELNDTSRLIDLLRTEGPEMQRKRLEVDFKRFYTQFDQRRGKDFVNTFDADVVDWYKNISPNYPEEEANVISSDRQLR